MADPTTPEILQEEEEPSLYDIPTAPAIVISSDEEEESSEEDPTEPITASNDLPPSQLDLEPTSAWLWTGKKASQCTDELRASTHRLRQLVKEISFQGPYRDRIRGYLNSGVAKKDHVSNVDGWTTTKALIDQPLTDESLDLASHRLALALRTITQDILLPQPLGSERNLSEIVDSAFDANLQPGSSSERQLTNDERDSLMLELSNLRTRLEMLAVESRRQLDWKASPPMRWTKTRSSGVSLAKRQAGVDAQRQELPIKGIQMSAKAQGKQPMTNSTASSYAKLRTIYRPLLPSLTPTEQARIKQTVRFLTPQVPSVVPPAHAQPGQSAQDDTAEPDVGHIFQWDPAWDPEVPEQEEVPNETGHLLENYGATTTTTTDAPIEISSPDEVQVVSGPRKRRERTTALDPLVLEAYEATTAWLWTGGKSTEITGDLLSSTKRLQKLVKHIASIPAYSARIQAYVMDCKSVTSEHGVGRGRVSAIDFIDGELTDVNLSINSHRVAMGLHSILHDITRLKPKGTSRTLLDLVYETLLRSEALSHDELAPLTKSFSALRQRLNVIAPDSRQALGWRRMPKVVWDPVDNSQTDRDRNRTIAPALEMSAPTRQNATSASGTGSLPLPYISEDTPQSGVAASEGQGYSDNLQAIELGDDDDDDDNDDRDEEGEDGSPWLEMARQPTLLPHTIGRDAEHDPDSLGMRDLALLSPVSSNSSHTSGKKRSFGGEGPSLHARKRSASGQGRSR